MATDQERVITLLRALDREEIAAILDTDVTTVHQALQGLGPLPAGGGGGLVVGPWVDVDYTTPGFPGNPDPLPVGTFDVPVEVLVIYVPQINTAGGFWIADENDVAYDSDFDNFGETTVTKKVRAIVPPNVAITVRMIGAMQEASMQNVKYRTLG